VKLNKLAELNFLRMTQKIEYFLIGIIADTEQREVFLRINKNSLGQMFHSV
jgi:hypothetical protein